MRSCSNPAGGQRVGRLTLAAVLLSLLPVQLLAFEWQPLDGLTIKLNNRISLGAAWRMEDRDPALIGKLNLNPALCDGDDCRDFGGDPTPNQRLVDAPGGLAAHNQDNGNLNYDKHDPVFATAIFTTDLSATWGETIFKFRGSAIFDEVNDDFIEKHPNNRLQPARSQRPRRIRDQVGSRLDIHEAFISTPFSLADRRFYLSVGEQRLRWGEATTIQLNSLNEINPPDQNLLYFPGNELRDIFQPVGLVTLGTDITDNIAMELVYQYRWEPIRPAAAGSFLSVSDLAGGGDYAVISEGQFPEDPQFIGKPQGTFGLISSTSFSVPILPESFGEPRDGGQYGISLRGYLDNFLDGTEWGLYYLNYHSRLPYGSLFATDESCWRDSTNFVEAALACRGFNGSIEALPGGLGAAIPPEILDLIGSDGTLGGTAGVGREPVPIDTMKVFLEYPEDIRMYGVSFNTTVGLWSLAGEYSYRPNLPVQVQLQDVVFAGVNPIFPRVPLPIPGVATIPTAETTTPNFIESRFRGNRDIQANAYIRGWEPLKVGQLSMTAIRIISSSNPIGADQILFLAEAGFTHVIDMPGLDRVQFDGGGADATHASPGADGTGSGGVPNSARTVPTQQTDGFAEDFAWGYRLLSRVEYNDLIPSVPVFRPLLALFHDVSGVSVAPMQNFIEDRVQFVLGAQFEFNKKLSGQILYQGFTGGGDLNKLSDRDFLSVSLAYDF